jgi:hypothetical protein
VLSLRWPDGVVINDSNEVKQMGNRTDKSIVKGSPELALIAFAFMAVFAYILF